MPKFEPNNAYIRLMQYNWEMPDWPTFNFSTNEIEQQLHAFAIEVGEVNGILKALPFNLQQETLLETMIAEAIKSSAIEGEFFSREDVMSSMRNNLGLNKPLKFVKDKRVSGIADMMIDFRNSFNELLSVEKLFEWHKMLLKDSKGINLGCWRKGDDKMQIVSGSIGKEEIHFEAPPSNRVPLEMDNFVKWFNDTAPKAKYEISNPLIRAAITHLYFESIHPFEDGNGRIGRALAEKAISQTLERPIILNLSKSIEMNIKAYYSSLKKAQKSTDVSAWVKYFVETALLAQKEVKTLVEFTLKKTIFFDKHKNKLNERQLKAINKMVDAGINGFEGGMTANKYMSITKTSKATATRDLQNLVEEHILIMIGGGRSIHYYLNF